MVPRLAPVPPRNSFFLFGPRGTGKTTLLRERFKASRCLWLDLLDPRTEDRFVKDPSLLADQVREIGEGLEWVVVDEVQRAPRLLDVVHGLLETTSLRFALTGSSARKLKRGASNLLAGRAFVVHLHPLTHRELGRQFDLAHALAWGSLPRLLSFHDDQERALFLEAYGHTYLREEILAEQIIRKDRPFRLFLELAAQTSGEVLNFKAIADDIGVDGKTVRAYYEILEDTSIGFLLPAYHQSVRRQQAMSPKFYLFDCGVKRAMDRSLDVPLKKGTYSYGRAFEHFVVLEIYRLNGYRRKNYRLYHLLTKDGAEIDLVVERPGKPPALVEIKSTDAVKERHLRSLQRFAADLADWEAFCLSQDPIARRVGRVRVLPWKAGIEELGL